MRSTRLLTLSGALVVATLGVGHAQEPRSTPLYRPTWTFQLENDFFAQLTNSDEHYTNGLRIARLGGDLRRDGFAEAWVWDAMEGVFGVLPGGAYLAAKQVGFSIGQNLFTPDDTDRADPVVDDRPYAGWLYAGVSLHETFERAGVPVHQDVMELQIGVIGPHAYGESVQNELHDLIGVAGANGWDNQLRDEIGVNLVAQRKWRRSLIGPGEVDCLLGSCLEADFIPHLGLSLGTVQTYGAAGGLMRFGHNLGTDFGPPRILPGLPGSETVRDGGDWGWYVYIGAEARAVARDIFLDGNTFRDSPSVDRRPFVGDLQIGAAVTYDAWRFTLTHVLRTSEFETQDGADEFGAISLTRRF